MSLFTLSISISSVGNDDISFSRLASSAASLSFFFSKTEHFCFIMSISSLICSSASCSSTTIPARSFCLYLLIKTAVSADSFLASLNFWSNRSKSRNFAKISFRLVDPSLIKDKESNCDAIEVIMKSSIEPRVFLMLASVSLRVSPFILSSVVML